MSDYNYQNILTDLWEWLNDQRSAVAPWVKGDKASPNLTADIVQDKIREITSRHGIANTLPKADDLTKAAQALAEAAPTIKDVTTGMADTFDGSSPAEPITEDAVMALKPGESLRGVWKGNEVDIARHDEGIFIDSEQGFERNIESSSPSWGQVISALAKIKAKSL